MTLQHTRVLIADDHILVLQGLQELLKLECRLVETVTKTDEILTKTKEFRPDVVLLDVEMAEADGFSIARQLQKECPVVKIIFVTMHDEPTSIAEAFKAGAKGYVLKQSVTSDLVTAIEKVLKNHHYISPLIPEGIRETVEAQLQGIPTDGLSGRLTPQQKEVLRLIARGLTAKEIASALHIAVSTVAFHKTNIMQELGLKTKAELTKYAVAHGIEPLNPSETSPSKG